MNKVIPKIIWTGYIKKIVRCLPLNMAGIVLAALGGNPANGALLKFSLKKLFEEDRRFILRTALISSVMLLAGAGWGAPTVNGLFYGDGDITQYPSIPYAVSTSGSKLYLSYVNGTVYVALVVDRVVNDNAFDSGLTSYMTSAGWQNTPTTAGHRCNSEFAGFTMQVVSGTTTNSWAWQQGYAGQTGGGAPETRNNRTLATWRSDATVSGGLGTPPPGLVSASSMMWNMNTYATMLAGGTNTWTMPGTDANSSLWKSPWNPTNPNTVVNPVEGYPATGQITYSPTYRWEWPMVYEWAVDLTQFGAAPVFVITGLSHHSPRKTTLETDDPFLPGDDPDPLLDFGDLPSPYPTLRADNGARHAIDPVGAYLGTSLDSEADGQPHPLALGDNLGGADDEDGVALRSPIIPGSNSLIRVTVSGGSGYLSAFADWTGVGMLTQMTLVSATGPTTLLPGPIGDMAMDEGVYTLTVAVPAVIATNIAVRFRVTNRAGDGGAAPTGLAMSGEVEDYLWERDLTLSTEIALKVYAANDGKVMIEIATVNENGNNDIEIYAMLNGEWVLVAIVPSAQIVGFGSNVYTVEAFGLTPGESYLFRIVDESGHIFESEPITVALSPILVESVTLTPELIKVAFNTEYGLFYQVMVCEQLGAPWVVEYVRYPTARGLSALSNEPFMAGPGERTEVLIPRNNRPQAFFRITKVQ